MICPKCHAENRDQAKFCNECGGKIEISCPACGRPNRPGSRFCDECGQDLRAPSKAVPKDLSFDEKLAKIQRYLPKGLTEKIISQRDRIEGERKQVTVLFCDMEGFTALSEKLGLEEMYGLMDQVYEILIHKVHEYEGTVNELTGDGVMALFGAPIALEDAPQRAIRSALAIHKEMTRFNERMKHQGSPSPRPSPDFPPPLTGEGEGGGPAGWRPIRMRIGIHSGPVVLGTVGNDLRVDFKAVGDTVNLASRLQSLAEPGTVYVTEDTFKLTEGLFRFEALGEKQVKGKEAPVGVYQVIAPSTRRTRFDVSAERGLTPFVGRAREFELLLEAWERAKEGRGQAVSIVADAGLGKSRLLYEFRKSVSNEETTFLEGKCVSYGRSMAYHPIADVLKGNFDIRDEDRDDAIREKVQRALKVLKADEATTLPYLLELLGVKDSGIDKIPMSPEGRKDRIIEAVKQIILKGAQIRPLLIAIEDLHWADKSTEDALKWLLEAIPGGRILVLFTYRPEFVHTWGGRSYHNQMTLNRLSNRESLLMVSHLLGSEEIDPELQMLILGKTEGVPFFVEEFVKSLEGLQVIGRQDGMASLLGDLQSLAIPSTIQDMIMARVDRLPDQTKAVLQTGSVIEREFPHELIRVVTGFPETELLAHLSALKDAELLYERGIYPQTSYIFRHALTREVVYGSILAKRRKELHGQIGTAIEELHKDDLADHYEVLSEHFSQCEDYPKAAEYCKRAARKAEKSASFPDAIAHARKRVICLEQSSEAGGSGNWRELIDARTVLGVYLAQMNHLLKAMEAVEPVAQLARDRSYWRRIGQIQTVMGCCYGFVDEELPRAINALEDALAIAEREKDILTLVLASYWLGSCQVMDCRFREARIPLQRALDINVAVGNLWGIAATKASLAYSCYYYPAKIMELVELSSEALKIAQESGDIYSRGIAHTVYGASCYARHQLENAGEHLVEGMRLCERIGMFSWAATACAHMAETYFEMKDYHKSRECFAQARRIFHRAPMVPSWSRWAELGMAMCGVMVGERDANLEPLRAIAKKNRLKVAEGWNCRYLGEILLRLGGEHLAEAEQWIQRALESAETNGLRFLLGLDHAVYADFHKTKGNGDKAKEELGKAIEILSECGADGWVEKYERELAALA